MSSLLCVLAVVAVATFTAAQDCNHGFSNGCSVPHNLPFFYKDKFRHACDRHDICYACGSGRGISKHTCDLHLHRDAVDVCNGKRKRFIIASTLDFATTTFCDEIANAYYGAVGLFGSDYYSTSPLDFCSQSWVSSCLT